MPAFIVIHVIINELGALCYEVLYHKEYVLTRIPYDMRLQRITTYGGDKLQLLYQKYIGDIILT